MRLFINKGICKRKWNGNILVRQKNGVVILRFPNYNEEKGDSEFVDFIIPNVKRKMLKNNTWIYNLVLEQNESNRIVFADECYSCTGEIYALIRSTEAVPDDVYIKKEECAKVEIIRRIRFVDSECDLGDFLSNVYFIKIKLDRKEKIALYLTYEDAKYLRKAIIFSRNVEGTWVANVEIKKDNNIDGKYVSLSELI